VKEHWLATSMRIHQEERTLFVALAKYLNNKAFTWLVFEHCSGLIEEQ
jgi:hypothetical protein